MRTNSFLLYLHQEIFFNFRLGDGLIYPLRGDRGSPETMDLLNERGKLLDEGESESCDESTTRQSHVETINENDSDEYELTVSVCNTRNVITYK